MMDTYKCNQTDYHGEVVRLRRRIEQLEAGLAKWKPRNDEMSDTKYPKYLDLRDTGLHDDLGGSGKRIWTTAGQGYERRRYVREDYYIEQAERIEKLEAENKRLIGIPEHITDDRGAICAIISDMLDNPNEHGIYPTTIAFNRLEELVRKAREEK